MDMYRAVVSLENRAQSAYSAHLYEDAILLHSRAVTVAKEPTKLAAVLFSRLGETLEATGDALDAATVYEAGFQSLSPQPHVDVEQVLVSLRSVGPAFYHFDRMDIPDSYDSPTAEALKSAMAEPSLSARLLLNCAEIYQRQAHTQLSLHAYKRALSQLESLDMLELRMYTLARLGTIAYQHGELSVVETTLDEVLQLRDVTTEPHAQCHVLSALGNIYEVLGQGQQALNAYRQALSLSLQSGDPIAIGHTRGQLVRLSTQQRHRQLAEQRHMQERARGAVNGRNEVQPSAEPEVLQPQVLRRRTVGQMLNKSRAYT